MCSDKRKSHGLPCRKTCRTWTPPQWPHEAVDHWFFPCVLSQPFQEYFLVCDPLKTSMVERHGRMNCKEVVARKALVRIRSSTLVGGIEKCGVEISTGRSWTHKVEMEGWYEIILNERLCRFISVKVSSPPIVPLLRTSRNFRPHILPIN